MGTIFLRFDRSSQGRFLNFCRNVKCTDVRETFQLDTTLTFACSFEIMLSFSNRVNFPIYVYCPVPSITRKFKALYYILYQQIYSGARDGSVVASKLDLRVYHPCKVKKYIIVIYSIYSTGRKPLTYLY